MRQHHVITYASLFLVACLMVVPVNASAEKSLEDVQEQREEVKEDLSEAENKVADILIEIEDLEQEMDELDSIFEANKEQIKETEADMDKVQQEIDKLEQNIEERFEILKSRAKSYQESGGNVSFMDVLFKADSFTDFVGRVSAISQITEADSDLIKKQERDKKKVEEKMNSLEEMKAELEVKQKEIENQKEDQKKAKEELKNKKDQLKETVDELEMKDDKFSDLESKLTMEKDSDVNFAKDSGDGEFGWPTDGGYVSSPMGQRWGRTHKGIDIARTDRSTSPPIYAAESGTVQFAGQMSGYGNTVVIDHGDGMETLYGHMSSLKANQGQKVERGQQIGVMGQTGNSTGIHLHFEVHKNGGLQNPIGYLNR